MSALRLPLRLLGLLSLLITVVYWFSTGAHRGWSMDKVPVQQVDEITGLEYTSYEDRFVPGIDVLGGGIALGAGLFVVSFFLPKPRRETAAA